MKVGKFLFPIVCNVLDWMFKLFRFLNLKFLNLNVCIFELFLHFLKSFFNTGFNAYQGR